MRRWRALRLLSVTVALCVALAGLVMTPNAQVARTAGVGPCSPLTPSDLAYAPVTAKGNAWAELSRTQGTDGTLLLLSGGGWPANTPIGMDIWANYSGTFRGGPIYLRPVDGLVTALQGTTSASGALQFPAFRLDDACATGMSANGHPLTSVTILFVVHTLDGNYSQGSIRQPIQFTYVAPPWMKDVADMNAGNLEVQAGDARAISGAGFSPGDRVTIATRISRWPDETAWWGPLDQAVSTLVAPITLTVDSMGAVAFTYILPQTPPLSFVRMQFHVIDARLGDVTIVAYTTYTVVPAHLPTIQINRSTVAPGGNVMVTGSNWQPGQQGVIEYCRGMGEVISGAPYCNEYTTQTIGTFTVDSAGKFQAQARLPINARFGYVTLQARVNDADVKLEAFVAQLLAVSTPMTIETPPVHLTWAQIHPRRAWLMANAPYLGGGGAVLLVALVGLAFYMRRRRGGAGPQTA